MILIYKGKFTGDSAGCKIFLLKSGHWPGSLGRFQMSNRCMILFLINMTFYACLMNLNADNIVDGICNNACDI